MTNTSDVCLLIPYYQAGADLLLSLASVEADTLLPDVCIVDDGSLQAPARQVLADYQGPLPIHLIELAQNQGIEHALNAGLAYCVPRYKYIARLDCGDKNIGRRLADQRDFLQAHPDHAIVGGWARYVDLEGQPLFILQHPVDTASIRRKIFLNAPFTHPAIMMRSAVLSDVGFYPVDYPAAEDLALFFKIVGKYPTANLPYPIVIYEVNPNAISSLKRKTQIKSRVRLILANFDGSVIAIVGLTRGVV
ncbi:MAG: glycosyltransferase, partial [Alcaligenaceae bacterium]|nr:glycosyltransferase [Alcaligenaceae bacterium]